MNKLVLKARRSKFEIKNVRFEVGRPQLNKPNGARISSRKVRKVRRERERKEKDSAKEALGGRK
jgi:hypothetical protein